MNIKNNIKIIKLDDQGRGIGYISDKITFINDALPDEMVDIILIKETTKYNIGKVYKYIKKSSKRIDSKCPYYDKCGGCNLLHLSYNDQIDYKKEKLNSILKKFSKIDKEIEVIKNDNIFGYRNKIDLKIINNLWGYYNNNTHDFISIEKCLLAKNSINDVIKSKKYFDIKDGNIIIRSNYNDEIIININSTKKVNIDIDNLKKTIKLVGIVINDKLYYKDNYFIEKYNDKIFKINYNSFFQINRNITEKMIDIINDNIIGDTLLDLYCGVGFLGQIIDKKTKKLYGIEISQKSVLDAIENSKINKIKNSFYICGDSSKITNIKDDIDTLIIDPPRTGLVNNLVNDVINVKAKRIIYISCNPITLARDLNIIKDNYVIKSIYLLDMFSNTYHIESLIVLERK